MVSTHRCMQAGTQRKTRLFSLSSSAKASHQNLWGLVPLTTGFGSQLWCHACDTMLGVICQPIVAQFHIVLYFVMSQGGDVRSLWQLDRCCAGDITVLYLRHTHSTHTHTHTNTYILLFVMFTIHFDPGENQWTKEASVFHALLGWLGALYSWLLPVLPRSHKWMSKHTDLAYHSLFQN